MKRKIFLIAAAVCVLAIAACGSLAYFSAAKSVENTFMTAKSNPQNPPTPDELFSVKVEETKNGSQDKTTEGNTYEKVLPGSKFTKDPVITNTGAYDQWVRVLVTFDNVKAWNDAGVKMADLFSTLVTAGYKSEDWTMVAPQEAKDDKATFTFYYTKEGGKLAPEGEAALFTEVTVPTSLDAEDMATLSCFHIDIEAQAIQADNNGTTPQLGFANWIEPTK